MLPLCRSESIGVIPWSPLARGHLAGNRGRAAAATVRSRSDRVATNYYSADQDTAILEATRTVAERLGCPMAQVAYAWVASRPGVTAPIVGISKMEQFEDAVAALGLALSPEDVAALEEPYRPKPVAGHA